ncbi:hypothetical protein GCM10010174_24690 [Kutzneria viridogrisea]|uniref:Antitoxin n=1 Tax=Kutzneria albida DSM 43870 TaxID=1449976 RepID=W5W4P2_9PSEU|nr:hypothetical protein KALB_2489 [Kutzneria albida DSM 43870]
MDATVTEEQAQLTLTMRELGKLTAEHVRTFDRPVPVTSNGVPVAWLVPLTPAERLRAELIASGRLRPRRRPGLAELKSLAPAAEEEPLSEVLLRMRQQEHS